MQKYKIIAYNSKYFNLHVYGQAYALAKFQLYMP